MNRLLFIWMVFLLTVSACGTARRGEPFGSAMALTDSEISQGYVVFNEHCQRCHPGGEAGLGPSINDKPLPGFLIKRQVRHGLGDMPGFKEDKISDEQLKQLVKYLKALRKQK